jgi:hypothetical protein
MVAHLHRRRQFIHATAIALMMGIASLGLSTPAGAAGQSRSTYGCYVKWWNTAFASYCSPATRTGDYQTYVACSLLEGDYWGGLFYFKSGRYVTWDSKSCRYWVDYANMYYYYSP